MTTPGKHQTLAGEPCSADWQALQNLCDMHGLELRENRFNKLGDSGYTAIMRRPNGVSASAYIPYNYTLDEATEWIARFCESHKKD